RPPDLPGVAHGVQGSLPVLGGPFVVPGDQSVVIVVVVHRWHAFPPLAQRRRVAAIGHRTGQEPVTQFPVAVRSQPVLAVAHAGLTMACPVTNSGRWQVASRRMTSSPWTWWR